MIKSLQWVSQKFTMGQFYTWYDCNNSFIDLPIRVFDQMATKSLASINFDNLIILKYFVLWSWSETGFQTLESFVVKYQLTL